MLYEPKLLPRPLSGSMALLQPQSVLVLVIPFNNEGQEERTAQSWLHPFLAITLRSTGPTPHRPLELTLLVRTRVSWT